MLVSILIPFKNTEKYLPACLQSIIDQTFVNWEVIAVDDHSSDSSVEVVRSFAKMDKRILLFKNKGNGIIPTLRTAYKKAKGHYITRMDSDDIMKPKRLEIMAGALDAHGPGHLAVGQVEYFSEEGISDGYAKYQQWINTLTASGTNYEEIYKECVIPSPCWMAYRADLDSCGAFNSDRYPEDYDLTFRFYEKGLQVLPCQELLHLWRDYPSRTSRTHIHYAQNYFLDIKLYYFLKLDYDPARPLVVWGAGFKGKTIARNLLQQDIDFTWLCDNPNKIGKKIYNKPLVHFSSLDKLKQPQSLVTVANPTAQREIRAFLSSREHENMRDFFFFC